MKECISTAIVQNYSYFHSTNFLQDHLQIGGYELHFRNKVYEKLEKIMCCEHNDVLEIGKEKKIRGFTSRKRSDIFIEGNKLIIVEFGHYTTIQGSPHYAVNKPLSDINKWVNHCDQIYTVNVITHWLNLPPADYPYQQNKISQNRVNNLNYIEEHFYMIDPNLIKIVFRPTSDVEMHIYVKGPFDKISWQTIKTNLAGTPLLKKLDILKDS